MPLTQADKLSVKTWL